MFYISEIMTTAPDEYKNHLQQETYKALAQLKIPFERVDTDEAILDLDRDVQVIIDKDVANEDYYGCSDGTTTCYLKLRTADIIDKFLPFSKHKPVIIEI